MFISYEIIWQHHRDCWMCRHIIIWIMALICPIASAKVTEWQRESPSNDCSVGCWQKMWMTIAMKRPSHAWSHCFFWDTCRSSFHPPLTSQKSPQKFQKTSTSLLLQFFIPFKSHQQIMLQKFQVRGNVLLTREASTSSIYWQREHITFHLNFIIASAIVVWHTKKNHSSLIWHFLARIQNDHLLGNWILITFREWSELKSVRKSDRRAQLR